MAFDLTKLLTTAFLNDYKDKPITIDVKDLNDKYDIQITIKVKEK